MLPLKPDSPVESRSRTNAIHRFTIREEADDIVDSDACVLDDGAASMHVRQARDVTVTDAGNVFVPRCKNTSIQFTQRGFDIGPAGVSLPYLAGRWGTQAQE